MEPATVLPSDSAHAWLILMTLLVLALISALEPRLVPRGQWIVVLRAGRAVRVVESGTTLRLPLVQRYARLPRGRTRHLFLVVGRTAEGIDVRLSGEVVIEIIDPAQAAELSRVPIELALDETERALKRMAAGSDVVSLADPPIDLGIDLPGVLITDLRIDKVEIELTALALQAVADQTK